MTRFYYKAKKGPELYVEDFLEAESMDDATQKLLQKGLVPVDIQEKSAPKAAPVKAVVRLEIKPVKQKEIVVFTRQLSDLIGANVTVLRALKIISRQTKNPSFHQMIESLYKFVEDGGAFSQSLAQYPQAFSPLYFNMIRTGEISGTLDVVLNRLAEYLEKEQQMRSKVLGSLAYPVLILAVGFITMIVMMTFVVPQLTVVFDDLGQELPKITQMFIALSHLFIKFWCLLMGGGVMLILGMRAFYSSVQGRKAVDEVFLKIPFYGDFIKIVEVGRFSRTLATLIHAGVSITAALESVVLTMENQELKEKMALAAVEVTKGSSLESALTKYAIFPEYALSMISVGEETGKLEHGLERIAITFERRAEQIIKTMVSLIGPLVLVLVVLFIGLIIVAMLLPIMNMNVLV